MNTLTALNEKLIHTLDEQGYEWLNNAKSQLAQLNGDIESTANKLIFFTSTAKRKLGIKLLDAEINSGLTPDKYNQCGICNLYHWSVTDAARILLLTETIVSKAFSADEFFQLCYRYSDEGERASLLKGLALFNLTDQSTPFIIDIARTNSLEIFSALTYKNPWPAINFPTPAFNQIVLKSLFSGMNIMFLEGLHAARNSELGRMAADYAQERMDAKREIPESIWLAVDVNLLTEQGVAVWESALHSEPSKNQYQLALTGCQWQSNLPLRLAQLTSNK